MKMFRVKVSFATNKGRFCTIIASVVLVHNRPEQVGKTVTCCGLKVVFKRSWTKVPKSKVLSGGFRLPNSKAELRASRFLHIHFSNVNSYSSASESIRQNSPDRTLDLSFFSHYENIPSPSPSESLLYRFQGNFCGYVYFELLVERISFVFIP